MCIYFLGTYGTSRYSIPYKAEWVLFPISRNTGEAFTRIIFLMQCSIMIFFVTKLSYPMWEHFYDMKSCSALKII